MLLKHLRGKTLEAKAHLELKLMSDIKGCKVKIYT